MKFKITNTNWWEPDKLIEQYPCLEHFGFSVETVEVPVRTPIRDENGKKIFFDTSKQKKIAYVEIQDLADLIRLIDYIEHPLVIGEEKEISIEIYDGWRE